MSARGRLAAIDASRLRIATTWAGQRPVSGSGGSLRSRCLSVGALGCRRLKAQLVDRVASSHREVDGTRVLYRPARRREHAVDLDPGLRLGRQVCDSTDTHRANLPRRGDTRRSAGYAKTLTSRYSVSRWTGILPNERMRWTSSSVVVRCVVPAAETTFSSIITEPMSSAPKPSATCPTFIPCVTQDDWIWGTLSR